MSKIFHLTKVITLAPCRYCGAKTNRSHDYRCVNSPYADETNQSEVDTHD